LNFNVIIFDPLTSAIFGNGRIPLLKSPVTLKVPLVTFHIESIVLDFITMFDCFIFAPIFG